MIRGLIFGVTSSSFCDSANASTKRSRKCERLANLWIVSVNYLTCVIYLKGSVMFRCASVCVGSNRWFRVRFNWYVWNWVVSIASRCGCGGGGSVDKAVRRACWFSTGCFTSTAQHFTPSYTIFILLPNSDRVLNVRYMLVYNIYRVRGIQEGSIDVLLQSEWHHCELEIYMYFSLGMINGIPRDIVPLVSCITEYVSYFSLASMELVSTRFLYCLKHKSKLEGVIFDARTSLWCHSLSSSSSLSRAQSCTEGNYYYYMSK